MKPIVFLNVTWMERYEGRSGKDEKMSGGGSYVDEHGYGHELFNFKKIDGKVYGYVQPRGANNLKHLGASEHDELIEGVLAVFTARHKDGGTYVVGWYKDATFYKHYQEESIPERYYRGSYIGYYVVANANNAILLSKDERIAFPVPRGKGGMGQSNVWYATAPESITFKSDLLAKIKAYEEKQTIKEQLIMARQLDPELKKKVETIAITEVRTEYEERGFEVTSVEKENLGWDLEARHKTTTLKIEVKGLSGSIVSVQLTSNEFEKMKTHYDTYRLAIVTDCLTKPIVRIFSYSAEAGEWRSEEDESLLIEEIISARCFT